MSGVNPEVTPAGRALQVVAPLHLSEGGPQILGIGAVEQSVEGGDSGRTSNEKLNPARIADHIRFLLLGNPHFARVHAYRARKHSLPINGWHLSPSRRHASFDICASLIKDGRGREVRQKLGVLSG